VSARSAPRARVLRAAALLCAGALAPLLPAAAAGSGELGTITVTATRVAANSFNVPAAVSSVPAEALRDDALGVNISDDLAFVPGLLARNRNNYAQDQQISIRGIGANSTFGIRGVRIYQDGIPATGPDGQGQVSQFNLDSAARVEVLRGPFSALYGNSSGGVIQIFTADGSRPDTLRSALVDGSFATWRAALEASGAAGTFGYNAAYTHFGFDGFRPHSAARSDSLNGKLDYDFNADNRLALIFNVLARPDAQDPLGLTAAQFSAYPNQTAAAALAFDTRKSLGQQQAGLVWDIGLTDSQALRVMTYYGHRSVLQFLAIPVASQTPPTSSGGVVDLERNYGGADTRWSWQSELAGRPFSWIAGVSYDRQNELRRGYDNFVGATLGVQGALRRDENDITYDLDEYTQAGWDLTSRWSLMAGIRHSDVNFRVADRFITAANGDDSGSATYQAASPVAGLLFKARPWLHLYASYGQGFQTPLGSELAYRADGGSGPNLGLRPARSDNVELGAKIDARPDLGAETTVFETRTQNEIVIDSNVGGRTTYENSGRTRRSGAEASLDYRFARRWRMQLAYTYIDATYTDAYLTCSAVPCAVPNTVIAAGNRLPGVPRSDGFASLRWGGELGVHLAASAQYVSDVPVNDVNTVSAPAYAVFGLDGGYRARGARSEWNAFMRINNLFDRRYVGSVIVDDGNARYFEPAAGFNLLVGVSASWH
jgi:iron complex outermembrane recepter protein